MQKLLLLFVVIIISKKSEAQVLNKNLFANTSFSFLNNFSAYNQKDLPNVKIFTFNEDMNYFHDSTDKSLQWHLYIDYGFRHIKDSLTEKTSDVFSFDVTKEQSEIADNIKQSFTFNINTQLTPTKQLQYNEDYTTQEKLVVSSFMSPGQIMFGSGFTKTFLKNIKLTINPVGITMNTFFNQKVYDNLQQDEINYVPRNKNVEFEFMNMLKVSVNRRYHFTAKNPKQKDLSWLLNASAFYMPISGNYAIRAMNNLNWNVFKFLTVGFQTQLLLNRSINTFNEKINTRLNYGYRIQLGFVF